MDIQIKTYKPQGHYVKALIYGPSGAGKTVFGSTAPRPIFASAESGLLSIAEKAPSYVDIRSFADLQNLLSFLRKDGHDFKTVIIDSISEINEIIKQEIEKKTGKALESRDWDDLSKKLRSILRAFRDLPMHVLFISLEKAEKDEDKIVKIVPLLNGKAATEVASYMDIVGYLEVGKDGTRSVITGEHSKYLTKDRTGRISTDQSPDFKGWIEKINMIEIGEEEIVGELHGDDAVSSGGITNTKKAELVSLWGKFFNLCMVRYKGVKASNDKLIYVVENKERLFTQRLVKEFDKSYLIELTEEEGDKFKSMLLDKIGILKEEVAEMEQAEADAGIEEDAADEELPDQKPTPPRVNLKPAPKPTPTPPKQ
jgi:hypothetical protein